MNPFVELPTIPIRCGSTSGRVWIQSRMIGTYSSAVAAISWRYFSPSRDAERDASTHLPTVFSAGNVVTGKGNIVASRKHAREVTETVLEAFLGIGEGDGHAGEEAIADAVSAHAREGAQKIADEIAVQPPISAAALAAVRERVSKRQQAVGYGGDYGAWVRGGSRD